MSDVQSRPSAPRGRSSARGGRGGHRGSTRSSKQTNGDRLLDSTADEGELGELKSQYKSQLTTIRELFPDWTDMDLLLGLQDCNGDLEATIERITEGNVSQFSEVHKKSKDRSRSKVKDASNTDSGAQGRSARGRGGQEGSRGARGRADRGRGGFRGGRGGTHASTNGTRSADAGASVPTTESSAYANNAWDKADASSTDAPSEGLPKSNAKPVPTPEIKKVTPVPEGPPKKTWASMFAPKPAPAPPKPAAQPALVKETPPPPQELPAQEIEPEPAQPELSTTSTDADEVDEPEPPTVNEPEDPSPEPVAELAAIPLQLTPSKDQLTTDNVEHIPDSSKPAPTETAASTVASESVAGTPAALTGAHQPPIGRPTGMSGFATSAYKATATPGRSASYQRRLFEQQEAVVMPGNHAVDRAAVQFGNFKLNGDVDSPLDVDEDREEAETRTQPPQHSPTAQPRTSLPPVPRQVQAPSEPLPQEPAISTPKQAPGLPPVPQQPVAVVQQQSPQNSVAAPAPALPQQASQGNQQYGQFGRFNQAGIPAEPAAVTAQKSYDLFGNQTQQSAQYENFAAQSQAASQQPQQPQQQQQQQPQSQQQPQQQPQQPPQQPQTGLGGFSSAPNDYPSYYTADQRNAYQSYYGSYGQQGSSLNQQQTSVSQEAAGAGQQRSGSAFGSGPSDSAFPSSQAQQIPSRYSDAQNSGQNTPNPVQNAPQSQQGQHMHQQPHAQSGHNAGYGGYTHPYYQTPYYQNYMNQYGGYGGQGFGPYGGKGSMYGQPHHAYGMSPQTPYDQHSSSPANAGGFGQSSMHGRDGVLGGGFGEYGRSSSTQPSSGAQHAAGNAGFGGMSDPFGRSQGGFPGQSQSYGQQQTNQQAGSDDALKPFGDTKTSAGPSPALGQPGRPGSATNTASTQGNQTGLPPAQSHQQGFSGYPSHISQGNQYGALGGLGGHQTGPQSYQAGGYGYGGGFGTNHYGGRGWGANFSGHQNH